MRSTQTLRAAASIAVLAALSIGANAQAQTTAETGVQADSADLTVDALIVTAQKREQNLQDVPVVVTSLPEKLLQNSGVRDIKDLTLLTAGMIVTSTTSEASTTARIRGVGTVGDNPGLESSVGVVIDGVYRPRNGVSFGDLGEMQRIEVLKGPQGSLFGKNTSAGVINVLTKGPEWTFGGQAEATYGNYDARGASVSVTGPIIPDKLAGRLYVVGRERDGFNDVVVGKGPNTVTQDADQEFWSVRAQALFTPAEDATFRFIADYTNRSENCCGAVQIRTGPTASVINALAAPFKGVSNPADPYDRVVYSNRGAPQDFIDMGLSMQADFDIGWADITAITALRNWKTDQGQDSDFSTADIAYRAKDGTNFVKFNTFSQEVRIAGTSGKLDWLAGMFFADERLVNDSNFLFGADYERYFGLLLSNGASANFVAALTGRPPGSNFPQGAGQRDHYNQRATTLAGFTNNTFHVTDAFDVTVGLRYSWDTKKVDTYQANSGSSIACAAALGRQAQIAGVVGAAQTPTIIGNLCLPWANPFFNGLTYTQYDDDKQWSGTVKASYRFSPGAFAYASYARGYKAGGYNLDRSQSSNGLQSGGPGVVPVTNTFFAPETVDSYEVGAKTTLLNRSLLLNGSLFHQQFDNFQLNTFLGTSFVVRSIPTVKSKGVDLDLLWFAPVRGLSVQAGYTYALTKYGDEAVPNDPTNALVLLPGSRLSLAPKHSASAAVTYETPVGTSLKALFNLGGKYVSAYNTGSDLFPPKNQRGFTVFNGRVGFGSDDERWMFEFWGQNLFNKKYVQVAFNGVLQGQSGLSATNRIYNPALDTITYDAFLGAPRTYGVTLRSKF
ncbi:TonB-dependent receptor [Phenylobacterium immobile]|uniref:TonB-dependent receptor n=1 Tax=Phenylobacterium immobile TaxID=21 RepID=UPI000AAB1DB6|nr:TonB-dependent receptor [Phenylobacterium immobile]